MTEEEAMDYYIQQLRAAVQRGETKVALTTQFEDNDYREILQDACETVQAETGCSVRVTSTSYTTGNSTVTISLPTEK